MKILFTVATSHNEITVRISVIWTRVTVSYFWPSPECSIFRCLGWSLHL